MKIGITGATGQLGSKVLEFINSIKGDEEIIGLVRSPEKLTAQGYSARAFDYTSDNLADTLEGIDRLLLISGNEIGKRAEQHTNVIEAAKKAGVKWIVYTSILDADKTSISLADEHLATEDALKSSGLAYTILRHGWYTENYTSSIPGALGAGAFVGSAGNGKISSATRQDFAEADARVILDENYQNQTLELAGDTAYTLDELAAEISEQTGKAIPYNNLPEADYAGILKQIGLPEGFAYAIANWDVSASKDDLYSEDKTLSTIIDRPTTPLKTAVSEALASAPAEA